MFQSLQQLSVLCLRRVNGCCFASGLFFSNKIMARTLQLWNLLKQETFSCATISKFKRFCLLLNVLLMFVPISGPLKKSDFGASQCIKNLIQYILLCIFTFPCNSTMPALLFFTFIRCRNGNRLHWCQMRSDAYRIYQDFTSCFLQTAMFQITALCLQLRQRTSCNTDSWQIHGHCQLAHLVNEL